MRFLLSLVLLACGTLHGRGRRPRYETSEDLRGHRRRAAMAGERHPRLPDEEPQGRGTVRRAPQGRRAGREHEALARRAGDLLRREAGYREVGGKADKDALFVFYYCGHGLPHPSGGVCLANYDLQPESLASPACSLPT